MRLRFCHVVDPERITAVEVEFQVAGAAAGPIRLQSGGTYGEPGWGRAANRLAPMVQRLYTDEGPLCSAPSPGWLELESLTPEVCRVVALAPIALGTPDGYLLYGDRTDTDGLHE